MSVTIRDVAQLAGVSASTVSRTIRNNPAISAATKAKVRAAIEQLGYECPMPEDDADAQAAAPLEVGIIFPPSHTDTYNNPFFLEVIQGISEFCNENGAIPILMTGKNDADVIDQITRTHPTSRIAAYIVLFSRVGDPIVSALYDQGCEYVLLGTPMQYANETVSVDNDNISAGMAAANYLYALGHRRFCFIGSPFTNLFSASRKNGVILALSDHGITPDQIQIVEMEHGSLDGLEKIRQILAMDDDKRPTAFVTSDDLHALALRQLGVEASLFIPTDFSIVSFNNSVFARLISPQLTSIDVHPAQLGREAANQAISRARVPSSMASKTLVPFSLVERDSCREIE